MPFWITWVARAARAVVIGGQIELGPDLSVADEYDLSVPVSRRRIDVRSSYLQACRARHTGGRARRTVDESQGVSILRDRGQRERAAARSRDSILAAERNPQPDGAVGPRDAGLSSCASVSTVPATLAWLSKFNATIWFTAVYCPDDETPPELTNVRFDPF